MQARGDGVIRITDRSELIQISSALVRRADGFLAQHAADLETIKRLFCLQLAHVPREGEPVRRRAPKSNCTDAEWLLIEKMSGADWRLLVTSELDGTPQAEIAHEVLLGEWPTLRRWLLEEREFLADALKLRDDVLREAKEWADGGRHPESLVRRGERLHAALALATSEDFKSALAPAAEYLKACRKLERSARTRAGTRIQLVGGHHHRARWGDQ